MLCALKFLVLAVGVLGFVASGSSFAQIGYVHEVSGTVTGQVGTGQPVAATTGQTLIPNATVATGPKSYAVLKFEDGTVVVLKENTSFQIQHYTHSAKAPEQSNAVFNMVRGGFRMITGLITSRNREALKVATPLVTIGMRGTDFAAELVNPLIVQTFSGVVSLTNAAGTVLVSAGQIGAVATSTSLGSVGAAGVGPVPNIPNVPTPPATPGPAPAGGTPIGGGVGGAGGATTAAIVIIGAAAAAGVIAASDNESTTTHH